MLRNATLSVLFVCLFFGSVAAQPTPPAQVKTLKITILSTMLADEGIGEWGFAALVEADGNRLLVDTGARPNTVLTNVHDLQIDLSDVKAVVLTHNHDDHTGGLLTLREEFLKKNPSALSVAHVGKGIFYNRPRPNGQEGNTVIAMSKQYEATGGKFVRARQPGGNISRRLAHRSCSSQVPRAQLVWKGNGAHTCRRSRRQHSRGPVNRHQHQGWSRRPNRMRTCRHRKHPYLCGRPVPQHSVYAVIGGVHLFAATDEQVNWTADKFKDFGVNYFIGAHCTGINTVYAIRDRMKLPRKSAVVGAVGATFVLGEGIHPGQLAQ